MQPRRTGSSPCKGPVPAYLQARELKKWGADGVIVGSALVRALGEALTKVTENLRQLALSWLALSWLLL